MGGQSRQSRGGGPRAPGPPITGALTPADEALWCRLTKPVPAGGLLSVLLSAEPHSIPSHPVKKEPAEPECLAPSHADIQLLPQQAGMASILATAVINSKYTLMPPQLHGREDSTFPGVQRCRWYPGAQDLQRSVTTRI